jgi:DNA-binding transcriptional MocR family regulator
LSFTGNGRQALSAALAALVPAGQRVGVEALSYQSGPASPLELGIEIVPLPMDEHGLRVDGLRAAHRRTPFRAIYVQPTMHNPLGMTMPVKRRQELVRALRDLNVIGIEDHVYAFLVDDVSPLASLAPDHVVMIDSLSKRVAPGADDRMGAGADAPGAGDCRGDSRQRARAVRDSRWSWAFGDCGRHGGASDP